MINYVDSLLVVKLPQLISLNCDAFSECSHGLCEGIAGVQPVSIRKSRA